MSGVISKMFSKRGVALALVISAILIFGFDIAPIVRYLLLILIFFVCISGLAHKGGNGNGNEYWSVVFHTPLFWLLGALFLAGLGGVFFSPEPFSSLKNFWSEFFLNFLAYVSVSLFFLKNNLPKRWMHFLLGVNALFVLVYLALLAQWVLFPTSPLFPRDDANVTGSGVSLFFNFGNGSEIFNGIKHTSLFLTLMISISFGILAMRHPLSRYAAILLLLDLFLLFSTTRRAAIIAVFSTMFLMSFLMATARKYAALALVFLSVLFGLIWITGSQEHFIREDWSLICQGKIEKAKELGGSIPLRFVTYREFLKEIAKEPFRPKGLGKKLIRVYHPQLVKRAGLQHGHNVFIDYAFELGVQGALLLFFVCMNQGILFFRAFKESNDIEEKTLLFASISFLLMFWGANMFTDGFVNDTSAIYWLFTGLATAVALKSKKMEYLSYSSNRASTN